jgi:hypothetical protein
MITSPPSSSRCLTKTQLAADLCIVGGGMAGVCAALTAARAGLRVILVQDRPVLGGNASSEVRLWLLGATCHLHGPNRWSREGGIIDEIMVENLWRNPEGNPLFFDALLLEKVVSEPNITLLLNTAAHDVEKSDPDTIAAVRTFCSQNSTMYEIRAPLFCDASGDGVVAFLAGAAFRMGAESSDEFGEKFAPTREFGELLGHSIYFYSKDTGRPVRFVPPSFALRDVPGQIPRFRDFNTREDGCRLWWIEYGGRLDTVHDTERIKWELWKVAYGVWDYIKNSGKFPEAANLTLEWIGHIPGKRESRRFEGDYLMTQHDVMDQRSHPDAVAYGGWALDLHPADGVYSPLPGYTHWRPKGIYPIPYRSLYSRNINNLFLAGRIISVTHVAFGSTRVMATLAHAAQAVALAAVLCRRHGLMPRQVGEPARMAELQLELLRRYQHIPGLRLADPLDLARKARITASSRFQLAELPANGPVLPLDRSRAQMLPLAKGPAPTVQFIVDVAEPTTLVLELRVSEKPANYTTERLLGRREIKLAAGPRQTVTAAFEAAIDQRGYAFYCLLQNPHVSVHATDQRLTGILAVHHFYWQGAPPDIGVPAFDVWTPARRPGGQNLAIHVSPPLDLFGPDNLVNGLQRPTTQPNAWVAGLDDPRPTVTLGWDRPQTIRRLELAFDPDFDHPMETVLMGHPENASPFCVRHYRVRDAAGRVIAECTDNHQGHATHCLPEPVVADRLTIECCASHGPVPAALFEVRCYG